MLRHVGEQKSAWRHRIALDAFTTEDFLEIYFFARLEWGKDDLVIVARSEFGIAHHFWASLCEKNLAFLVSSPTPAPPPQHLKATPRS
jgi:hypothetical protein